MPPSENDSSPNESSIAPEGDDLDRIDRHSDTARAEWARRLDVSQARLEEAMAAVGDRAVDVQKFLANGAP